MFDFNGLQPEIQTGAYDLFFAASDAGLAPQLTSGLRSATQQFRLWRAYLRGGRSFPAAPPGLSAHEYGIAFDMTATPFESLADIGATWQDWGGSWGGAADPVHFQIPGAQSYIMRHLSVKALVVGIDFAISFLPVVGVAVTFASVLQLYPQWAHNSVLEAISSPAEVLASL